MPAYPTVDSGRVLSWAEVLLLFKQKVVEDDSSEDFLRSGVG